MIHNIIKKITCSDMSECSDNIRTKLEENLKIKLMASTRTDTINGYISIEHLPNNHKIHVCVYEKNESANEKHLTTFKKPNKIPTKKQCENCLN
jgi:hypothetical protein